MGDDYGRRRPYVDQRKLHTYMMLVTQTAKALLPQKCDTQGDRANLRDGGRQVHNNRARQQQFETNSIKRLDFFELHSCRFSLSSNTRRNRPGFDVN